MQQQKITLQNILLIAAAPSGSQPELMSVIMCDVQFHLICILIFLSGSKYNIMIIIS